MYVRTETDREHGMVRVVLTGALTENAAVAARRVLDAVPGGTQRVIVDLRRLDDVDASLALVLLEQDERLARAGGWLLLVHGPGRAGSSLRFMGLHDRIRSSPSLVATGWAGRPARRTPRTTTGGRAGGLVGTRRQ
jgi:anti-anti-sigma regulatory factor